MHELSVVHSPPGCNAPVQLANLLFYCCTGLAVVWDMLLTTQFLTLVMMTVWHTPTPIAVCFHVFFSAIEATFFSACAEKVPTGKRSRLELSTLAATCSLTVPQATPCLCRALASSSSVAAKNICPEDGCISIVANQTHCQHLSCV